MKQIEISKKILSLWKGIAAGLFMTLLSTFFLFTIFSQDFRKDSSEFLTTVLPAKLVELTNSDRKANQLPPLTLNLSLKRAAQMKANDMAAKGYFAHQSPEGKTPWFWFQKAGYDFLYAGENIAVKFSDSAAVNEAWMNSPTHRANILGERFSEIGIAIAEGTYKGKQTTFVVQMFGTRMPTLSAIRSFVKRAPIVLASADIRNESNEKVELFVAVKNQSTPLSAENPVNFLSLLGVYLKENILARLN